ncbi:MAG: fumarylacetoacetate hydrolase family protein [Bacteroidetes bacterium]|nr:fumarylacetoacetate hydrolase family protein [Bacteroidota bacterium]
MKIICIGRNYAEHAKELNNDLPEEPLFFLKPDTALLKEKDFYYPNFTNDLHFECEIVVKIDKVGKNIEQKFANKYYSEITLGIDFTARDLQQKCKEKGLPWEKAKGFDNSAPISNKWVKLKDIDFASTEFCFFQNNEQRQQGFTRDMIFNIDEIIAYVSKFITLKTGDLIFTGTPAGVGPVAIGDILRATLNGEEMFLFHVK